MNVANITNQLQEYIEIEGFKGYDPYDALNSKILNRLCLNLKYPRIAVTQFFKRAPINLRPLVGIEKGYNPKAIGLFLWSYAKLYKITQKAKYLDKIDSLLKLLKQFQSRGYSGSCWGYNFDWQSISAFTPKFTPTIVNSSFIGHALIDTFRYTKKSNALDIAVSIKDFILHDLNRLHDRDSFCFSYTPNGFSSVHNANLLGASLLIRLYRYIGDENLKKSALQSLSFSMKRQNPDGSWDYGEGKNQRWIDSFHTGFNLQSIYYFLEEGFAERYKNNFLKGVRYYHDEFFLSDGKPKYYNNKIYPIDIHSPAQAIVFFSKMGCDYLMILNKLLEWMTKNMRDKNGYFYYQKYKYFCNKIPYIRWSQAWVFHCLTEYLSFKDGEGGPLS